VKADAAPLVDLVERKMRMKVPRVQRQHVWSREQEGGRSRKTSRVMGVSSTRIVCDPFDPKAQR